MNKMNQTSQNQRISIPLPTLKIVLKCLKSYYFMSILKKILLKLKLILIWNTFSFFYDDDDKIMESCKVVVSVENIYYF